MAACGHFGSPKITLDLISGHFRSIHNFIFFEIFDKMAVVGHFGCPKFTLDHISGHFRSIDFLFFWIFFTKWLLVAILDVRKSLSILFLSISHRYATLIFFEIFDKMADVGHFGCPKFTFDRISGNFQIDRPFWISEIHFRSIRNFFLNFLTKWPPVAILDGTKMSIIERVRDIWMSNACVFGLCQFPRPPPPPLFDVQEWRGPPPPLPRFERTLHMMLGYVKNRQPVLFHSHQRQMFDMPLPNSFHKNVGNNIKREENIK